MILNKIANKQNWKVARYSLTGLTALALPLDTVVTWNGALGTSSPAYLTLMVQCATSRGVYVTACVPSGSLYTLDLITSPRSFCHMTLTACHLTTCHAQLTFSILSKS